MRLTFDQFKDVIDNVDPDDFKTKRPFLERCYEALKKADLLARIKEIKVSEHVGDIDRRAELLELASRITQAELTRDGLHGKVCNVKGAFASDVVEVADAIIAEVNRVSEAGNRRMGTGSQASDEMAELRRLWLTQCGEEWYVNDDPTASAVWAWFTARGVKL